VNDTADAGQPDAGLSRAVAARLLAASKNAVADGVDVPASKTKIFAAAYSWWRFTCRSAEAVLLLGEHGFTIEASPIVRNVVNHAYALHWLADNGDPAVTALMANSLEEAEKLGKKLELSGWPGAAEYRGILEQRKTQVAAALDDTDPELHRKLKNEARNFYDMLDHYASAGVYPVYSYLSSMSHTSMETANAYLHWLDDGTFQIRDTAGSNGDAAIIQIALSLLQATDVISRLIDGDPLRAAINSARADLGY
jgi:hypothetical protein